MSHSVYSSSIHTIPNLKTMQMHSHNKTNGSIFMEQNPIWQWRWENVHETVHIHNSICMFKNRQNQPLVIEDRAVAAPRWGCGLRLLTEKKKLWECWEYFVYWLPLCISLSCIFSNLSAIIFLMTQGRYLNLYLLNLT